MHVLIKSEFTGNAWWPICPLSVKYSFTNDEQYKIFGVVYLADTTAFRKQWYEASKMTTWDAVCK